ncbi:replication protein P [Photobacterium nomapromontoriensis]|uniref:replication protein P n=1 Tax=Photobacterium nomapromontoriensis TaxID=2910237 RepID=UPI003D0E6EC4
MKNIAEITERMKISRQPDPKQAVNQIDEFAMQNINQIFKELCAILPAWRNHLRTADEFKTTRAAFAKGMMENGIVNMSQVHRGLTMARQQESDFFPSVGKFCGWCKDDQWQEAFQRMIRREAPQSLAEKKTRREISWAVQNTLSACDAEKKFRVVFTKYQGLERAGLLTELPQLPARSCVSEFDKKRNANNVRPEQFNKGSVFARIALRGMTHHE